LHYRIKLRSNETRAKGDTLGEYIAYSPDPPPRVLQYETGDASLQEHNAVQQT